jgi:16S rRNA (guanine(966)-N(2))-methyltransferase RsmD
MSLRLSGGRKLQSPPGDKARPTASRVRLAVMNMLATELPQASWLDLCCGSGVMGCEALQRGAAQVVAVEQDRAISQVARSNLQLVASGLASAPAVEVIHQEALRWLNSATVHPFDLIYADPPYAAGLYGPLLQAIRERGWLQPQGQALLEYATKNPPELPAGWVLNKHKSYGTSSVLLVSQA